MTYTSLTNSPDKQSWIDWLKNTAKVLDGQPETKDNPLFSTPDGDVANAKDLVGNLLATLTNETITIN